MKSLRITLMVILFMAGVLTAYAEPRANMSFDCGDMHFYYDPHGGVRLSLFDISMINGSSFWVVEPGWVSHLYGSPKNPFLMEEATIEDYQGGKRITLHHKLPADFDCPFEGTETFTLLPDNTFTAAVKFHLVKDVPADLEWGVAMVSVDSIIGSPYSAKTAKGEIEGRIAVKPVSSEIDKAMVAQDFDSIHIDSRLGGIDILSDTTAGLIFFDYRKNRWADPKKPMFWMGLMGGSLEYGKNYSYSVTFKFPQDSALQGKQIDEVVAKVKTQKVKEVQVPKWGKDYIIPTPKQLKWTESRFPLSKHTTIYVGEQPGAEIEKALAFVLKDLKDLFQVEPRVVRAAPKAGRVPENAILVGRRTQFRLPAELCGKAGLRIPEHPDGYSLLVDNDVAYVAADTDVGVFYGLTTLLQLSAVDKKGLYLKGAEVVDYPALDFRGVHCLSGKDAGDQIAKTIRTLMARFKMNELVWECEYIIWDTQPELEHAQFGMTKQDARKVVEAARDNFVDLIPLVQSLGHSEWIFTNGQNLDIAEDPEDPYAYSPTVPRTYDFIFTVYQEALDFFQPKYFHIGHDEVTMRGRFPWRSKESGKSVTELVLEDIDRLHDWFSERDVRLMMWGDMCLWKDEATDATFAPSSEEAKVRREGLPDDMIITDWHYAPEAPEDYTSIPMWKNEGFDVIGSGWYNPMNIANLAKACADVDALGYLQTTWAGFNFKIDDNEEAWYQYWAYILAAEYAWSGENTPLDELSFNVQDVFLDLWNETKPLQKTRKGFYVDLKPVLNRKLEDDPNYSGWIGYGPDLDFSRFPTGTVLEGSTRFKLEKNQAGEGALLLAGRLNPVGTFPKSVILDVKSQRAAELHFLMNTGFRARENAKLGEIEIVYTDGTSQVMELRYGKNLFSQTDERCGLNARIAWKGQGRDGSTIHAWDVVWTNPEPRKRIDRVVLRSSGAEAAPILLAMTGVI